MIFSKKYLYLPKGTAQFNTMYYESRIKLI
jgi:hypothetical protein